MKVIGMVVLFVCLGLSFDASAFCSVTDDDFHECMENERQDRRDEQRLDELERRQQESERRERQHREAEERQRRPRCGFDGLPC